MVRVMVVAAYASVRAGLRVLLAQEDGCEVVAEATGAEDLAAAAGEARPDVLLFDYAPQDVARVLAAASDAGIAVVMLGDHPHDYRLLADLPLPGWAWLPRDAGAVELGAAARAAAAGLAVLDRAAVETLGRPDPIVAGTADDAEIADALTTREREVLQLMAQGLPNKAIAGRLGISLHTAKTHVAAILGKLGAASRTEAVTVGARRGLVAL